MTERQASELVSRYSARKNVYMCGMYSINKRWCVYVWLRGVKKPRIIRTYEPTAYAPCE